jgi:NAD(P)-dependent dehydrogenase (short-subunit alcohol dehydrogenase family)
VDLFDLQGEVALVTGAGSGIGRRIAVGLAEAGADVVCFDLPRQSDALEATSLCIRALGRRSIAVAGDVTREADLRAAVDAAEAQLGDLSIGMNCAGIADAAPAEQMPYAQWRRVHAVNVDGVFLSCQAQARAMLPRRRGALVNIASMSGSIANRGLLQAHYNSSKAAVIQLSKSLAMEWAASGIRVNSISPGYTATPMNLRPEVAEQTRAFERDTPLGRMATVDEMVGPAIFLASRAASFCTGVDLVVDGGFVCW